MERETPCSWSGTQTALVVGGLTLVGGLLRCWSLGSKSLWIDETFSIGMATQSWPSFWRTISAVQPNMELFYTLLKFWVAITPASWHGQEWFWRCLPALAGTGVIPATFALARRLLGPLTASSAAALVATNAFLIEYSQQARGYTLFVLLYVLSWLALHRWLASGRQGDLLAFSLLAALGFLTQAFELVFLAAQLITVVALAWRGQQIRWERLGLALVPLAALVALRAPIYGAHPDQVAWIPRPTAHDLLRGFQQMVGGDGGAGSRAGLMLVAVALAAVGVVGVGVARQGLNGAGLPLVWLLLPVLGTWVASQIKPLWVTRYLAPASVAAALVMAAAIGWVAQRRDPAPWRVGVTLGLTALCVMLGAWPLGDYLQRPGWEDWRGAARYVDAQFQSGDGMVCYDNQWGCEFGFRAYFQHAQFDPTAPGAFSWATYARADRETLFARAVDPAALAPYLATHSRVWVLLGHYVSGQGHWQDGLAWLNGHSHQMAYLVFAGDVVVALYHTDPGGAS